MAIKRFCDLCDVEITRNYTSDRISGKGYQPSGNKPLLVEIIVGSGRGVWNNGEVCRDCLRRAVLDAIDSDVGEQTRNLPRSLDTAS